MKAHDGVRFAVVEGAFLPDVLEPIEKLVKEAGGACVTAAAPPPDTDFVVIPRYADAADAVLVTRLIEGDLEEWKGITLVTADWIKLSIEMVEKFEELYAEYSIGNTKDVRTMTAPELELHPRPIPIGNGLIVDVEAMLQEGDSKLNGHVTSRPSTPAIAQHKDDSVMEETPKPGYHFTVTDKAAFPMSPGTPSPTLELDSTLSAPPTPPKSKSKNAQRKAARKRAKNKKKNLGEFEETEGDAESTTTDQSKTQEPELTVWDRVRNLKNRAEITLSVTDRTPSNTVQLQTFNDSQDCNWCGSVHDKNQSFEIWGQLADTLFPKQTIIDNLFLKNATANRTGWEQTPRRKGDKPRLGWESIRDAVTPTSSTFFTTELFDAFIRCLNDQLVEKDVKALVLGTAYWTELFEECMQKHPARGPVSQYGLIRVGHTDLSFAQYDRIVFPIRIEHLWSVAVLDIGNRVVIWYDAFGSNDLDKSVASKVARILDVLVITDPDVGTFDWKIVEVHEPYVEERVNCSGAHAAITCEILARQGMANDHVIQWMMIDFRRTWYGPTMPKSVPESWLLRAIRWILLICAKGEYPSGAWDADTRCLKGAESAPQPAEEDVAGDPMEANGLKISGIDAEAAA